MNTKHRTFKRSDAFTAMLIAWDQPSPGRGLPWAFNSDPYIVWISEIMLQQTRAETVVPYFEKFIREFPTIEALAVAPLDHVLRLWAGLGYYSRARNLHASAQIICEDHNGIFPRTFCEVLKLPGVGRSTAGAICSLAFEMRHPILDGNAKRVYSRFFGVDVEPENERIKTLWNLADLHTPKDDVQQYTQRIMDLGATVCLPRIPKCETCPLSIGCYALQHQQTHRLPLKRKPKHRPEKLTTMIMAIDLKGRILLERRPESGIWGGLWSLPEYEGSLENLTVWMQSFYDVHVNPEDAWNTVTHDFTHFRLLISPLPVRITKFNSKFFDRSDLTLYRPKSDFDRGIPTPIHKLIRQIPDSFAGPD